MSHVHVKPNLPFCGLICNTHEYHYMEIVVCDCVYKYFFAVLSVGVYCGCTLCVHLCIHVHWSLGVYISVYLVSMYVLVCAILLAVLVCAILLSVLVCAILLSVLVCAILLSVLVCAILLSVLVCAILLSVLVCAILLSVLYVVGYFL